MQLHGVQAYLVDDPCDLRGRGVPEHSHDQGRRRARKCPIRGDIFSAPGLELVSIGPGDLSESYDAPGMALRAEPVMSALERAIRFCTPRNIAVMTIPTPDLSNEWALEIVGKGARVIWYGGDIMNIGRYFKRIASLKDPRGSSG